MIRFFKTRPVLSILLLAISLRFLLFILILLRNPSGIYFFDSNGYWNLAFNLREYGVFSQAADFPLDPDYYRTPLYPIFILISERFGPEGFSITFFQIILSTFTCYFTYKIAIELTGNKRIALIALFIVAVDIPSISLSNMVLTETLFSFLFLWSCWQFLKYYKSREPMKLVGAGILIGLSILVRPIGFFIPILFSLFVIYKNKSNFKKMFYGLAILNLIVLLTVSPWLVRNKITFNHYFLSVIREHNMLNYQAAPVYAERFNYSLPKAQSTLRWKTFNEFKGDANGQPYEYADYIEKESFKIISNYPQIYLKQRVKQFILFFLKPTRAYVDIQLGNWGQGYNTIPQDYPILKYLFENNSTITITLVLFQLLVLLTLNFAIFLGWFYLRKMKNNFSLIFLTSIIFCFAFSTITNVTEARFRVPVVPMIAILGSCGMVFLWEKINYRKVKK